LNDKTKGSEGARYPKSLNSNYQVFGSIETLTKKPQHESQVRY